TLLVKRGRAFHLSDKPVKSDSELYNEAKRSVRSKQKGVFFGTSAATYLSRSSSRSLSTTAAAVASSSSLLQSSSSSGKKSLRLASGERCAPHERLLVLGSGVAGCAAALTAARHGVPVTVLHAGSVKEDCNSYWAQGGVIYRNYRLKEKDGSEKLVDTPLSLVNDIRIASGYRGALQRNTPLEECHYDASLLLNDPTSSKMGQICSTAGVNWNEDAAWKLALEGPTRVRQLLLGPQDDGAGHTSTGCVVPFDRTTLPTAGPDDDNDGMGKESPEDNTVLSLCLEASHAAPRIIHHADCTGRAITESITRAAAAHPLIEFRGDSIATDLISDEHSDGMVIGAKVLDKNTNKIEAAYAVHGVVLASGGLGGIYEHSTNPGGFNALGSSVALALRLEERLNSSLPGESGITSDLEYVQFHPTSLCLPNEARFLLTEALRGEGAILRDASGRAFASDYHPSAELAPRDIVARAVFTESQKAAADGSDGHNAFLDMTHRDASWLRDRFPTIHSHLSSRDSPMDFTKEKIPVIPAAHYTCGGVTSDLSGRVHGSGGQVHRNLYVAGEAARTGLHGGNRLASTSLLEGLVFGSSVGELVAGVVSDDDAMEKREELIQTMEGARYAIERRLAVEEQSYTSDGDARPVDEKVGDEASALLARLKSVMWDGVGVVRTPSGLADASSELAAMKDEAEFIWDRAGGDWRAAAVRDAARSGLAVAEAASANDVSGGAHYVLHEEVRSEPVSDAALVGAAGGGFGSEDDEEEEALVAAVVL
ncbi:hypothetical protein THAOC_07523, partial [Thalassiosira oceanica]